MRGLIERCTFAQTHWRVSEFQNIFFISRLPGSFEVAAKGAGPCLLWARWNGSPDRHIGLSTASPAQMNESLSGPNSH